MKKIQHNEPEIQQKQGGRGQPLTDEKEILKEEVGTAPNDVLVERAIEAIISHRNWRDDSNWEEALKVWSETMNRLEEGLRDKGFGDELDEAIRDLDAENAEYKKKHEV